MKVHFVFGKGFVCVRTCVCMCIVYICVANGRVMFFLTDSQSDSWRWMWQWIIHQAWSENWKLLLCWTGNTSPGGQVTFNWFCLLYV